MTTKSMNKTLDDNLRRLHTYAQNVETTVRRGVEDTAQVGREAEAVNLDFVAFLDNWTAMLPVVHDLADDAGVDPSVLASGWGDLLLTIRGRVAANEELRETMETSIANKIANALMIVRNLDLLAEIDFIMIANQVSLIKDVQTVRAAVGEIKKRGGDGLERLQWFADALKENGY